MMREESVRLFVNFQGKAFPSFCPRAGAAAAESTESAEMPPSSAPGLATSRGGAPDFSGAPRWLRRVRCAVPLPAPTKQAGPWAIRVVSLDKTNKTMCARVVQAAAAAPVHSSPGRVLRVNSGLVFARCIFSAPSAPDGPCIATGDRREITCPCLSPSLSLCLSLSLSLSFREIKSFSVL